MASIWHLLFFPIGQHVQVWLNLSLTFHQHGMDNVMHIAQAQTNIPKVWRSWLNLILTLFHQHGIVFRTWTTWCTLPRLRKIYPQFGTWCFTSENMGSHVNLKRNHYFGVCHKLILWPVWQGRRQRFLQCDAKHHFVSMWCLASNCLNSDIKKCDISPSWIPWGETPQGVHDVLRNCPWPGTKNMDLVWPASSSGPTNPYLPRQYSARLKRSRALGQTILLSCLDNTPQASTMHCEGCWTKGPKHGSCLTGVWRASCGPNNAYLPRQYGVWLKRLWPQALQSCTAWPAASLASSTPGSFGCGLAPVTMCLPWSHGNQQSPFRWALCFCNFDAGSLTDRLCKSLRGTQASVQSIKLKLATSK